MKYVSGTIDKEYPRKTGGYAFEFGEEAAAKRIISRVNPVFDVQFVTAFKKDSQGLTDDDRYLLLSPSEHVPLHVRL